MKKNFVTAPIIIKREENLNNQILEQFINRNYEQDYLPNQILHLLANKGNYSKNFIIKNYVHVDGRLYYQNHFYVPNYHILQPYFHYLHYNSPYVGHLGIANIYKLLYRNYYCPNM